MSETARLIAEARDVGIRFDFDGEHLSVCAAHRPPHEIVDRLRAAQPQLEPLLRAERDLLQKASVMDRLVDGEVTDPTTASSFITATRELNRAFLDGDLERIQAAASAWRTALPTRSAFSLKEGPAEAAVQELDRAYQRLGRVLSEFPDLHRPTWDEYKPLERQRNAECDSGDPERGLTAIAVWERGVVGLLSIPDRDGPV